MLLYRIPAGIGFTDLERLSVATLLLVFSHCSIYRHTSSLTIWSSSHIGMISRTIARTIIRVISHSIIVWAMSIYVRTIFSGHSLCWSCAITSFVSWTLMIASWVIVVVSLALRVPALSEKTLIVMAFTRNYINIFCDNVTHYFVSEKGFFDSILSY